VIRIHPLTPERRPDFFRLHSTDNGWGECFCVAWWVDTWKDWGERTAEQNRALREELFARGQDDGYLAYDDDGPVGWCQVGPRDRLAKLTKQYGLEPDPSAYAMTCFFVAPRARGTGVARALLDAAIDDLRARGIERLEAFPRKGDSSDPLEVWTGPRALFERAGFVLEREEPRPIYVIRLRAG
jgi:GNAT superfamily N-acetyltransferase